MTLLQQSRRFVVSALAAALFSSVLYAQADGPAGIVVRDAWVRPTLGANPSSAAYATIENKSMAADRLISVSTPVAGQAEIHTTTMDGDVMRMRPVEDGVAIGPDEAVRLEPRGLHVMLMGVTGRLTVSDTVPLSLTFENAGTITVDAVVSMAPPEPDNGM